MKSDTMAKIILAEDDDDMRRFLVKALEKEIGRASCRERV